MINLGYIEIDKWWSFLFWAIIEYNKCSTSYNIATAFCCNITKDKDMNVSTVFDSNISGIKYCTRWHDPYHFNANAIIERCQHQKKQFINYLLFKFAMYCQMYLSRDARAVTPDYYNNLTRSYSLMMSVCAYMIKIHMT